MPRPKPGAFIVFVLATLLAVACDRYSPVAPNAKSLTAGRSVAAADTTPTDSTPYHGPVTISGTVFRLDTVRWHGSRDTVTTEPVVNAAIAVVEFASGDTVAQTATDSSGAFEVSDLTVGTYRLAVTPPAGSGLASTTVLVFAAQAVVRVRVWLWSVAASLSP